MNVTRGQDFTSSQIRNRGCFETLTFSYKELGYKELLIKNTTKSTTETVNRSGKVIQVFLLRMNISNQVWKSRR